MLLRRNLSVPRRFPQSITVRLRPPRDAKNTCPEDARGDVFRGLEVVEQACGVGVAMMGETLGGVAAGMDSFSYREPLGVCAGENA